jgi:hypothetical protein
MQEQGERVEQGEQVKFWRFCTMVLSAGLVIALLTHSGPREAGASEMGFAHADVSLRIGGFDSVDGEAVFVIEDAAGVRVGVLPMSADD